MKTAAYDTGVLIAADRSERRIWAEHRARLEAGSLLARSKTADVVDASLATVAIEHQVDVVSDDPDDIRRLLSAARARVRVLPF